MYKGLYFENRGLYNMLIISCKLLKSEAGQIHADKRLPWDSGEGKQGGTKVFKLDRNGCTILWRYLKPWNCVVKLDKMLHFILGVSSHNEINKVGDEGPILGKMESHPVSPTRCNYTFCLGCRELLPEVCEEPTVAGGLRKETRMGRPTRQGEFFPYPLLRITWHGFEAA